MHGTPYDGFAEIHPGMKPKEALEEANRCLYCYDAPCVKACPTGIDIPGFIRKIATGNLPGAARVILEANPVGATCARVCPTEELCEGACVLNKASRPIAIGLLQRYATDAAARRGEPVVRPGPKNGLKVAVIGGGPAGLSAARELARFGYAVTVFEAREKAGGLSTYGIVSFRLPQEVPEWEVEQIRSMGVEIRTGVRVGTDIPADRLIRDHDAVVLAAGMGKVPMLGIEGEDLEGVYDALEFIEATKTGSAPKGVRGARVAVIGAGNTAIDAATCSTRLGAANVKILYRRTEAEMTAYAFEYRFAKEEGVEFRWLTAPKRIIGDERGRVTRLECVRMRLTDTPGKDGRPMPVPVAGSEFQMNVDVVIKAIGQTRHLPLIEALGVAHERGVVIVDPDTHQTSNPKIYAAGDIVFGHGQGEATVVSAAEQGKRAARAIHRALQQAAAASA
mgnify:CR=1 FL=1|jgi:glutamate synthase (NADPH/NADH) small chain